MCECVCGEKRRRRVLSFSSQKQFAQDLINGRDDHVTEMRENDHHYYDCNLAGLSDLYCQLNCFVFESRQHAKVGNTYKMNG